MIVELYSQMFLYYHSVSLSLQVALLMFNLLQSEVKVLYTASLVLVRQEPILYLVTVYSNLKVILENQLHLHHILVLVLFTVSLVEQKHTLFSTKVEVYLMLVVLHSHKLLLTHRRLQVDYLDTLVLLTHTLLRHHLKESLEFKVQVENQLHLPHTLVLVFYSNMLELQLLLFKLRLVELYSVTLVELLMLNLVMVGRPLRKHIYLLEVTQVYSFYLSTLVLVHLIFLVILEKHMPDLHTSLKEDSLDLEMLQSVLQSRQKVAHYSPSRVRSQHLYLHSQNRDLYLQDSYQTKQLQYSNYVLLVLVLYTLNVELSTKHGVHSYQKVQVVYLDSLMVLNLLRLRQEVRLYSASRVLLKIVRSLTILVVVIYTVSLVQQNLILHLYSIQHCSEFLVLVQRHKQNQLLDSEDYHPQVEQQNLYSSMLLQRELYSPSRAMLEREKQTHSKDLDLHHSSGIQLGMLHRKLQEILLDLDLYLRLVDLQKLQHLLEQQTDCSISTALRIFREPNLLLVLDLYLLLAVQQKAYRMSKYHSFSLILVVLVRLVLLLHGMVLVKSELDLVTTEYLAMDLEVLPYSNLEFFLDVDLTVQLMDLQEHFKNPSHLHLMLLKVNLMLIHLPILVEMNQNILNLSVVNQRES